VLDEPGEVMMRPLPGLIFAGTITAAACAACMPLPVPAHSAAAVTWTARGLGDADTVRATVLASGATHVYVHDGRGPWAIHVVEIHRAACRPLIQARRPAGTLPARATTTELAAGTVAAINADFFMLPGGTPVGAHVEAGVPFIGPADWPVFAVTGGGRADWSAGWHAGRARISGRAATRGDTARIAQINRAPTPASSYAGTHDGLSLFTGRADSAPADDAARRLVLRLLDGDERGGRAIVLTSDSPAAAMPMPAETAVLLAHGTARPWAARRAAGDTVTWSAAVLVPAGAEEAGAPPHDLMVMEAVGGFPELIRDGADVLGTQAVRPAFGEQRHPRTAVGWTADGSRLFLVIVDGRQAPYSDGMSLSELVWLFRRLGAHHAVNLDGGGSTAMVVHGRLANRPSDADGERPVGNALALARCGLGQAL
jgi:hypothetical protein